jgi:hypothetical protein
METIKLLEAVRHATDAYGIDGRQTCAAPPTASEVIKRLAELGFVVAPRAQVCTSDNPLEHQGDTCPVHEDRFHENRTYVSESEARALDGNR